MKLYLGCAMPPFHEQHLSVLGDPNDWVWVDLYVTHPRIKQWDARNLSEVEDGSVAHIYASHLLEHLPHPQIPQILAHWRAKLQPGGKLTLNVPDLAWASRQVLRLEAEQPLDGIYNSFSKLLSVFYGTEEHEGEYHKSGYSAAYLRELLKAAGFAHVLVWQQWDAHDMQVIMAEASL